MKTFLSVVFLTVLSIGIAAPPARADDKVIQKELEAQYAKIEQAFQKKDLEALKAILASDFTASVKTPRKKITHDQMLQGWQRWFTVLKSISSQSHTITTLKVVGNKATAVVQYDMVFTEDHGSEGIRKADNRGPSRDTWIKSADGWKLLRAEDLGGTTKSEFEKQEKPSSEGKSVK